MFYFVLLFLLIFIIFLVCLYIYEFNKIVSSKQNVIESWADIDVQLNRRHNLIPNLVDTVKSYAKHEQTVFSQIAEFRARAMQLAPENISEKSVIEKDIEVNLHQILAIGENYPELKASDNYKKLQEELTETEDQIASSRRIYNSNVADYNTKISIFPLSIIARINHFELATFFQN